MAAYDIYGFMPIRKGSKGIPGKNVAQLAGWPLYEWRINEVRWITDLMICAHDYRPFLWVDKNDSHGVSEFARSAEGATDSASPEVVIREWIDCREHELGPLRDEDIFLYTQATNPWTVKDDYLEAIDLIRKSNDPDGYVVGACRVSPLMYRPAAKSVTLINVPQEYTDAARELIEQADRESAETLTIRPLFDRESRGNRQSSGYLLKENGSIYCTTIGALKRNGTHKGNLVGVVEMPEYTALEIDETHHLVMARALCEHYQCTPPELRNFIQ